MDQALTYSRKLAAKPRQALRATKHLMRRPREPLLQRVQAEGELFFKNLSSPAAREAMSAFVEKRAPDFSRLD